MNKFVKHPRFDSSKKIFDIAILPIEYLKEKYKTDEIKLIDIKELKIKEGDTIEIIGYPLMMSAKAEQANLYKSEGKIEKIYEY